MCEQFAMSSRTPATLSLSLNTFAKRAGHAGPHTDGWGITGYDDNNVRLVAFSRPPMRGHGNN